MQNISKQKSKKNKFTTSRLLAILLASSALPVSAVTNGEKNQPSNNGPNTDCEGCGSCTKLECEYDSKKKIKYKYTDYQERILHLPTVDIVEQIFDAKFVPDDPNGWDIKQSANGCFEFSATGKIVAYTYAGSGETTTDFETSYDFSYASGSGWSLDGYLFIRDSFNNTIDDGFGDIQIFTESAGCEKGESIYTWDHPLGSQSAWYVTTVDTISVESGGNGGNGGGGNAQKNPGNKKATCKPGENSDKLNSSLHFQIGLGRDSAGNSLGDLELYAEEWNSNLTLASSLLRWEDEKPFSNDSIAIDTVVLDNYQLVRENLVGGGYRLDFQEPAGGGNWDTYRSYKITSPSSEVLLIEESDENEDVVDTTRYTYSYDSVTGKRTWGLEEGLTGSLLPTSASRYEKVTKWTDDGGSPGDPSDDQDYEVRTVWAAQGGDLIAAQKRVYRYFGTTYPVRRITDWTWGTDFDEVADEPTGDLKTRKWTYYNSGSDQAKIKTHIDEYGNWEAVQYTTTGEIFEVIRSRNDNELIPLTSGGDWISLAANNISELYTNEFIDLERANYSAPAKVIGKRTFVGGTQQGAEFTITWPHSDTASDTREVWEVDATSEITSNPASHLISLVNDYEANGHSAVSDRLTIQTKYKPGTTIGSGTATVAVGSRMKEVIDWTGQVTEYTYFDDDQDTANYAEVTEVVSGWPGERVRRTTAEDPDWRKPIQFLVEREKAVDDWVHVSRTDYLAPDPSNPGVLIPGLDEAGRVRHREYYFGLAADPFGAGLAAWSTSQDFDCCYVSQTTDRNSVITTYDYDERGYLKASQTEGPSTNMYESRVNVYDPNGRVIATAIDVDDTYPLDSEILTQTNLGNTIVTGITEYDGNGRIASMTNALGHKTYYVYNEVVADTADTDFGKPTSTISGGYTGPVFQETRVYPDHSGTWTGGSDAPPIQITWTDAQGCVKRQWTASSTEAWGPGAGVVPDSETNTPGQELLGSDLTELSRTEYVCDWAGRITHTFAYETLPSGYGSTVNATTLAFTDGPVTETVYDVFGRAIRQIDASGNITAMVYDDKGRVSETWAGTDATSATASDPSGSGASNNNMEKVSETLYDTNRDGTGDQRSYATIVKRLKPTVVGQALEYVDTHMDVVWGDQIEIWPSVFVSGREVWSKPQDSLSPWTKQVYDMQGRLIVTESYANSSNTQGALIAKSENLYDDANDQPWRMLSTKVYSVTSGATGGFVETSYGYDEIERQVATESPTGAVTKSEYDVYGRMIRQWVAAGDNGQGDDLVVSETVYGYDEAGQVITTVTYDRLHNAASTAGLLSSNPSLAEARYAATWYDEAGRVTHSADYGNVAPVAP